MCVCDFALVYGRPLECAQRADFSRGIQCDAAQDQVSKDGFVISLKPQAGGRAVRLFVGEWQSLCGNLLRPASGAVCPSDCRGHTACILAAQPVRCLQAMHEGSTNL